MNLNDKNNINNDNLIKNDKNENEKKKLLKYYNILIFTKINNK